jgi:hypothetical protein
MVGGGTGCRWAPVLQGKAAQQCRPTTGAAVQASNRHGAGHVRSVANGEGQQWRGRPLAAGVEYGRWVVQEEHGRGGVWLDTQLSQ